MRWNLVTLCFSLLLAMPLSRAENIIVKPTGAYAAIDTHLANETIRSLQTAKPEAQAELIKKITGAPENYAPPVLYLVSSLLFKEDKKDEAMFWFYAGQLRGRIDAEICADRSAREAVAVLNQQFGLPINQYAFKDIPKLTATVENVLKWEEKTECKYDRRWINLHGMGAFVGDADAALSAPAAEWENIRKKTRDEYRTGFNEAMKGLAAKRH